MSQAAYLSAFGNQQFFTDQGIILAGGKINTYIAGTTTPARTCTNSTNSTPNSNPIILNSAGRPANEIWIPTGVPIKMVITDANNVPINPSTYDYISGIGDPTGISGGGGGGGTFSVWTVSGMTPIYTSPTTFTLTGNQVNIFQVRRRIRATIGSGYVYGTITSSVFTSLTTVTVTWDSTAIDNTLTAVDYSILDVIPGEVPHTQNSVSLLDYQADPTGVVDASTAFTAACNSLGATGGTVFVPDYGKFYFAVNITVPPNVTFKSNRDIIGVMTSNSQNSLYHNMGSSIRLASSATISLSAGACLEGLLIIPYGVTFPTTDSSAFAGTAITVIGDDACVKDCMILGFNQAITSNGFQRVKCYDLLMDNNNGIYINNSQDILHIARCHCWPFAVFRAGLTAAQMQRSGTAYSIANSNDWGKIVDSFSYGYNTGFLLNVVNSMELVSCGADNTANNYGSGFSLQGECYDNEFIGCEAAACIQGFIFNNSAEHSTVMTNCVSWGHNTHGILIDVSSYGDLFIRGGLIRGCTNGITYSTTHGGILDVDEMKFDSTVTVPLNITVSTNQVRIGPDNDFTNITAGSNPFSTITNVTIPTVASASVLLLPLTGQDFQISGTTTINYINVGWADRQVTLYFTGIVTVTNNPGGGYTALRLNSGTNFTSAAGSTLTLRHNGVIWYEIGRCA